MSIKIFFGLLMACSMRLMSASADIATLQQALIHAKNKHVMIEKALATNDKAIDKIVQNLRNIQLRIDPLKNEIKTLNQTLTMQQTQLKQQQALLMGHIRFRYRLGTTLTTTLMSPPTSPYSLDQLLRFHGYVFQSRERTLNRLKEIQQQLSTNQQRLQAKLSKDIVLQAKLHQQALTLKKYKLYHHAVIETLDKDIVTKQKLLAQFAANQHQIHQVIHTLPAKQPIQNTQALPSFSAMLHRLPSPVKGIHPVSSQQGLLFNAKEGASIYAVHAGKVVFSEWLKGYGLLIILDHGHGFMTLYAHQQSLFVHQGEMVAANQPIGTVGHSGNLSHDGLYFEVRQHAKVVPAMRWLA